MPPAIQARPAAAPETLPLRTRLREEMQGQIVHDSIHRREGWTSSFLLEVGSAPVGFGSVAIGGPWKDKPTAIEFYVLPDHRPRVFQLFEAFLASSGARFLELQSNAPLLTEMALCYGRDIASEKVVFRDGATTAHPSGGAILRRVTPEQEVRACLEQRQGGGEWVLELEGKVVASGGILFHYNRPYGDVHMEVPEPLRRRGFGTYLVQELKRACYALGAVPAARCNTTNVASWRTLQKAGFVPVGHILIGVIATP
jgi:GNAT superfamily N-acetyltransferase